MTAAQRILRSNPWTADTRSLALVRVALALILLADLVGRLPDLSLLYAADGILPAHTLLLATPKTLRVSYLLTTNRLTEVRVFFAVAAGVYLALLVGWQTRLMQILALIASVSLHARAPLVLHAGDALLDAILAWTLLLPLGRHMSLDAWLAPKGAPARPTTVRSLAVLGLWLELAAVFILGVINRTDPAWADGTAMHVLLWQDAVVRSPALWLRTHASPSLLAAMGHAMNALDVLAGIALLVPGRTRQVAAAALVPYTLGLSLLFNLGLYPLVIFAVLPLVVGPEPWRHLSATLSGRLPGVSRTLRERLEPTPLTRADLLEGGLREVLAASLLATQVASIPAYNAGLPESLRRPAPPWTRLWNDALGLHHRWALFGGDLPRQDQRLLFVAQTDDGRQLDLLTGAPARLDLPAARGSRQPADRLSLDLHLASGWSATLHDDLLRYARRAHTLPGSGIDRPLTHLRAILLERPIPAPGQLRRPPLARSERFRTQLHEPARPTDELLPRLARPTGPVFALPPEPTSQQILRPIAFDLLQAPRVLRLDGHIGDTAVAFALDSTSPVSILETGVLTALGDPHPFAPEISALPPLELAGNRYAGLPVVAGTLSKPLRDQGIVGVLGQDFLALHDVELDFARRTLTLLPPDAAGTPALPLAGLVPLPLQTTPGGATAVQIRLDDRVDGLGVFAFHAAPLRINAAARAAFGLQPADGSLELRYDEDGNPTFLRLLTLGKISAGPVFALRRGVVISDSPTFIALGLAQLPGALLGLETFPAGRAVFDYDRGTLYLGASDHLPRRP